MSTIPSPPPPSFSRQTTTETMYYDAEGNPMDVPTSPVTDTSGDKHPVPNDSGVDVSRNHPSTLQSPIPQNGFQSNGSAMRHANPEPYPMPQPQPPLNNNDRNLHYGAATADDRRSIPSMEVIYDETKGEYRRAGDGTNESFKRSASQQSHRSNKFGSNGTMNGRSGGSPNKLTKSQSTRSRAGTDRPMSRTSRRSAYEVVSSAPNATIGDAGGAFALGAAMTAPDANIHDELGQGFQERTLAAEGSLSKKQSLKIKKTEQGIGKRISRVIKNEGKAEQQALDAAIKELAEIQKMQQTAVKEGTRTHTQHTKSLQTLHHRELAVIKAQSDLERAEADIEARLAKARAELNKSKAKAQAQFDKARAEVEKARAEVKAHEDHREASRQHALETTEWVKDKRKEVEVLKGWLGVDEREREAKYNELTGKRRA